MALTTYQEKLIAAFPPAPFFGEASSHVECHEGIALRKELQGKSWTGISGEFIDFNSGSLPLLTRGGLLAFLPGWLLRSYERSGEEDCVLAEFTLYFLCPGSLDEERFDEQRIADRIAIFDPSQREVVRDYLNLIMSDTRHSDWHCYAGFGLRCWT